MKILFASAAVCFSLVCPSLPANALEFSTNANVLVMKGAIKNGDEFTFRDILDDAANAKLRVVRLNSTGGKVKPAVLMGRMIRARKMATVVDAKTDNCASACTVLFSAGATRHYLNADKIKDNIYAFRDLRIGLGYHEGNDPLSRDANRYSGAATAEMISAYYEFGTARARELITRSPPEKLYRISTETALSYGIATSSSAP